MVTLPRDLRLAVRTLLRKPGVTALAVASLGLAIGFSTAAFSILDAYFLRDLAVRDPDRLVRAYVQTREGRLSPVSWIEYQALATRVPSFAGLIVEDREGQPVRLAKGNDYPIVAYVSDNYFDMLGVKAGLGDVFHDGKGEDQTAVISYRYWQEALTGKPDIVGSTLPVGRTTLRIVGVLPPVFTGTSRGLVVDLFLPPQTFFGSLRALSPDDLKYNSYQLIGRLRPGATAEQARREGEAALRDVEAEGRAPAPQRKMMIDTFGAGSVGDKLESNATLLGIIVLLVLIAATNLANLRLVDNEGRRHETGVRLALGASRFDLGRIHIAETLLLSAISTAIGLGLAKWLIGLAPAIFYGDSRFTDYGIRLDSRTFAFSSAALLAVALLGAAIPMADAWRRRIVPALHGSRTTHASRWLAVLIVAQMAIVTGVVCSAALLWRSVDKLSQIRPAMDPGRNLLLIAATWDVPIPDARLSRIDAMAEQIARVPGVERVAWARRAMLSGSGGGAIVEVELPGQPKQQIYFNNVSAGYFATTGARVLGGRPFNLGDNANATPVMMVNPAFARRYLNGQDPVGQWIKAAGVDRQVVGVVEDGPHISLLENIPPYLYFPFAQRPLSYLTWFVETKGDPAGLAASVRNAMRGDPAQTLFGSQTLREHLRNSRRRQELAAQVSGSLATVGLLLAAAGLFGVTLFAVARRTPEFGVRVAMGASPGRLIRQVLREAGLRIVIAVPLGWLLAYAGRRAIEKQLYGVAPDDPWTFATASAIVATVALAAALQPALRAARIDPMTALRHE